MRESTQKILLLSYTPNLELSRKIPKEILRELLPELSSSGFRSLLYYLVKQHLVELVKSDIDTCVIGTPTGARYLEQLYPWLAHQGGQASDSELTGQLLIFQHGPSTDPQFRRLRRLALESGALVVARGVYFLPNQIPAGLMHEVISRYRGSVAVLATNRVVLGNISSTQARESVAKELWEISSGISTQLNQLIMVKNQLGSLNHQQKTQFFSLFSQITDLFGETKGQATLPLVAASQLRLTLSAATLLIGV